jgi:hypothetical protein
MEVASMFEPYDYAILDLAFHNIMAKLKDKPFNYMEFSKVAKKVFYTDSKSTVKALFNDAMENELIEEVGEDSYFFNGLSPMIDGPEIENFYN